ncbi:MAG TPA: Gfo/Idh/MocA family oxidoreductase, partial [Chitinophagaceae bacterium]|nr:Gfo/Idh/MocA family oxidoreductase [Chitinophagaceae bacterium]
MQKITWGIIGCGDVTEVKSGPAFNKVPDSQLVAVMRRDAVKAADYARRHNVPAWYSDADQLINDPNVNAIYIATPPSSHEEYTLAALRAGKPVYVEKPMTVSALSASNMVKAVNEAGVKLSVAHYRRAQPLFKKIKALIHTKAIGDIRCARITLYKKAWTDEELQKPGNAWRVDPLLSGGGLFHDLAPHQLDLMYYFFGAPQSAGGLAINQQKTYTADDVVSGYVLFPNDVLFSGLWCFNTAAAGELDVCEIIGSRGSISFAVFGEPKITMTINGVSESILFDPLPHVQQPMIEQVVKYFLDRGENPCSAIEGCEVMELID